MIDLGIFLLSAILPGLLIGAIWRRLGGRPGSHTRRLLRGVTIGLASLMVAGFVSWKFSGARTSQLFGEIIPRVETADSVVALTFDDGPLPGPTERILEILEKEQVPGTFFLIGESIRDHLPLAQQIVRAGHEVGNHSYTHQRMVGMSLGDIREEIEGTDTEIRRAGYTGDIHFRSPYGKKYVALPWYLSRTGRKNIFWDLEPDSHPEIAGDSARIAEHVLAGARPGSIILLHVMSRHYAPSLDAVPAIIRGLKERGYRFVTVSELLRRR